MADLFSICKANVVVERTDNGQFQYLDGGIVADGTMVVVDDFGSIETIGKVLPCDLPVDHELFDPFDWGDKPPVARAAPKDEFLPSADKLLETRSQWLGFSSESEMKAAQKLPKGQTHHARAIDALSKMYPGYRWKRTEWYVNAGQFVIKRDFQGFGDILGQRKRETKEGPPFVAGQITTSTQIMPHLRKYVSDAVSGGDEIPIEEFLRDFLALGNEMIILGYYREMVPRATGKGMKISNWKAKVVRTTPEMLDAAIARKRKR